MATVGELCNREVVVTSRDTSVADVARLMRDHHVGTVIIVEPRDGAQYPVGIITDRDIVVEVIAMDLAPRDLRAEEVMGRSLVIARENDGIRETLEVMRYRGVRRLAVLSTRGNLLGIIASDDLMKILAEDITALATITTRERWREAALRKPVSV
jgi:CBS domain-containing protein